MSMQDFPPLFGPRGEFVGYDDAMLATLTPQRRALYDAVHDAADAMVQADSDLQAATDLVRECVDAVRDAEKQQPPRMSQHDLWKQTFGRPRHA